MHEQLSYESMSPIYPNVLNSDDSSPQEVEEMSQPDTCLLSFKCQNDTNVLFDLALKFQHRIIRKFSTQAGWATRLLVPVKRFELAKDEWDKPYPEEPLEDENTAKRRLAYWYSATLRNWLEVQWSLFDQHRGYLNLPHSLLNYAQVTRLMPRKVSINHRLGKKGDIVTGDGKLQFQTHSQITLHTVIKNISTEELSNLHLSVVPFQDFGNGVHNLNLSEHLVWAGSLETGLPTVQPDKSHVHALSILFLRSGVYKIKCVCHKDSEDGMSDTSAVTVTQGPELTLEITD